MAATSPTPYILQYCQISFYVLFAYYLHMISIVGTGSVTSVSCGQVKFYRKCQCGHSEPVLFNCSSYSCPFCYSYAVSRASKQISARLSSIWSRPLKQAQLNTDFSLKNDNFLKNHAKYPYYHWVYSPALGFLSPDSTLADAYSHFFRVFRQSIQISAKKSYSKVGYGLIGVVVYHPRRLTDAGKAAVAAARAAAEPADDLGGAWDILHRLDLIDDTHTQFSPHFHFIANGLVSMSEQVHIRMAGSVLKRGRALRDADQIQVLVRYLLTHAGYEPRKKLYRYILPRGYTYTMFVVQSTEHQCVCPDCGRLLHDWRYGDPDDLNLCPVSFMRDKVYISYIVPRLSRRKKGGGK